ncbi:hypothetical protein, partial [Pseudomonas aeruginosa]
VEWPDGRGISGRIRVEWVAGSPWNRWSDAHGMGGQMTVESAVESQILGVIGSVLLLGAIAALWIGRLNSAAGKASAGEEAHSSNHHLDETLPAKPKINMVPHVSATPVQASPTEPERVIEMAKAEVHVEEPVLVTRPEVDCDDAAMNLQLADQLLVVGDFEGVAEYAKLVLEMDTASVRQRDRAQILLRREMAR